MMKFLSLLSLAAVAGGFGLCSLPPGEDDLVPSLQVAWKKLEVGREHPEDDPGTELEDEAGGCCCCSVRLGDRLGGG